RPPHRHRPAQRPGPPRRPRRRVPAPDRPNPGGLTMALTDARAVAVTAHLLTSYRRTWLDSVFNSFLLPVCLLIGIGWSVGRHVGPTPDLHTPYLDFVGAGLLAASVVQIGAAESAWAVFGGFEWSRIYHAIRLTPARPVDIMAGHLTAVVARAV